MALFCGTRILHRQLFAAVNRLPVTLASVNYAKLNIKPYQPPPPEGYDDKGARFNRPMSPHLSIYALQFTSMLSGSHRVTGMILGCYIIFVGFSALILPHDMSYYISIIESMNFSSITLFILKLLAGFPLAYHYSNGLRHLYWDTGRGLALKEVYSTGYLMMTVAAILTFGLACL